MTPKQVAAWIDWAATDNLDADQLGWWFVAFGEDRMTDPNPCVSAMVAAAKDR